MDLARCHGFPACGGGLLGERKQIPVARARRRERSNPEPGPAGETYDPVVLAAPPFSASGSPAVGAAQGISSRDGYRTAPSAGALYPLELQLVVGNVEGLPSGSYRYDAMNHTLEAMVPEDLRRTVAEAALHQGWIAQAPAIVIVSAVESRTTRKYGTRGVRYLHMEVGHASQNLLLQAVALRLSGAVVGAFDDERLKRLLQLLGEERPLAILPVGYRRSK